MSYRPSSYEPSPPPRREDLVPVRPFDGWQWLGLVALAVVIVAPLAHLGALLGLSPSVPLSTLGIIFLAFGSSMLIGYRSPAWAALGPTLSRSLGLFEVVLGSLFLVLEIAR